MRDREGKVLTERETSIAVRKVVECQNAVDTALREKARKP